MKYCSQTEPVSVIQSSKDRLRGKNRTSYHKGATRGGLDFWQPWNVKTELQPSEFSYSIAPSKSSLMFILPLSTTQCQFGMTTGSCLVSSYIVYFPSLLSFPFQFLLKNGSVWFSLQRDEAVLLSDCLFLPFSFQFTFNQNYVPHIFVPTGPLIWTCIWKENVVGSLQILSQSGYTYIVSYSTTRVDSKIYL